MSEISTKPYLVRAIYDWCTDSGFTPYIAVQVDDSVRVPREFVNQGEIVLNVSSFATQALQLDNEGISFRARFGGVPRDIWVPIANVMAIYARENGQGMAFEAHAPAEANDAEMTEPEDLTAEPAEPVRPVGPPSLSLAPPPATPAPEAPVPPPDEPPPPPGGDRPRLTRIK